MQNSGFTVATTDCGVTPQAREDRQLVVVDRNGIAVVGLGDILDAQKLGLAEMHGGAVHRGKRVVTCTARIASAGLKGRIDTTIGPWNGPAGLHWMLVRNIGTLLLQVLWRSSRPFSTSASSNENDSETNDTRSSRHTFLRSVTSSISSPFFQHLCSSGMSVRMSRSSPSDGSATFARFGLAEQWAGLGIELAEARKVGGQFLGQNGEVALDVARRCAGSRHVMTAGAGCGAHRGRFHPHFVLVAEEADVAAERNERQAPARAGAVVEADQFRAEADRRRP